MVEIYLIAVFSYAIGLMTGWALGLLVPKKIPKDEEGNKP